MGTSNQNSFLCKKHIFTLTHPCNPFKTITIKARTSEVKSSIYWNLIILPPLRLYVKSIWRILDVKKLSFLAKLEVLNLDLSKFEQCFKSQIYQNSNFRVSKIVKKDNFWYSNEAKIDYNCIYTLSALTSDFESFWSIVLRY